MTPPLDKLAANRAAAEERENGCRVFTSEEVDEDTGSRTFFAQVWLPDRLSPILNKRKGYETAAVRDSAISDLFNEFNAAVNGPPDAVIVKDADDALRATDAIFNGKQFAIRASPAADRTDADAENETDVAELQANGCRVYLSQLFEPETGKMLFCARVWLPSATKPVLDGSFPTPGARDKKVAIALATYDATTSRPATLPLSDPYASDRNSAELQSNGCRVFIWQTLREETGETLFCARVWLPGGTKPVLDAPFTTRAAREKKIVATMKVYEDSIAGEAALLPVPAAPAIEAVDIAGNVRHITGP